MVLLYFLKKACNLMHVMLILSAVRINNMCGQCDADNKSKDNTML